MLVNTRPEWKELAAHRATLEERSLCRLFDDDPKRGERFVASAAGWRVDYSKHLAVDRTWELFEALFAAIGVGEQRDRMFRGEKINSTEQRAVLHTALRNRTGEPLLVDGVDVTVDVERELKKMERFAYRVRSGEWKGHSGKPIRTVVNIGIGGSDLGPAMIVEGLTPFRTAESPEVFFVSNVDGAALFDTLARIDLTETLFLIASKTFTTQETMTNAFAAREALLRAFHGDLAAVGSHFVALSTNEKEVTAFGIDPANMFLFWDWVGGRYSSWSAIGLSIALSVGFDCFVELLEGAHAMDTHFRTAPFRKNLPMILAALGIWYGNFWGWESHAVLPYSHHLNRFPVFLQQLDMESNGKRVTAAGERLTADSGQIVWGEVGTNSQHAFFQLLHQGTRKVSTDFILAVRPEHQSDDHHRKLIANCLAQTEALMRGKTEEEVRRELAEKSGKGLPPDEIDRLAPHLVFEGNRPSTTLLTERLTPAALGSLIALYEHKVFVQGAVWGVNSFDQYGVELGKVLAVRILKELESGVVDETAHDSSTAALLRTVLSTLKK